MKNVIILTGPHASGKTTLMKMIAEGRSSAHLSPQDILSSYPFKKVVPETDIILIDEVNFDDRHQRAALAAICTAVTITCNAKYKLGFEKLRPEIVIASNGMSKDNCPEWFKRKHVKHIRLS